jgi:hypothetical protein
MEERKSRPYTKSKQRNYGYFQEAIGTYGPDALSLSKLIQPTMIVTSLLKRKTATSIFA